MSYNVVFLYIKDFWLNFIFETLDDKKNNQKIDQKRRLIKDAFKDVSQKYYIYWEKVLIVWLLERA